MSSNETSSPIGEELLLSGGFRSQDLMATTPDLKSGRQQSSSDSGRGDSPCKGNEISRSLFPGNMSRRILESSTAERNRLRLDEETLRFPEAAGTRIALHNQSVASITKFCSALVRLGW